MFPDIRALIIAVLISTAVGFGTGYYTAHRFDQTTALSLQVKQKQNVIDALNLQIETIKSAQEADGLKAQENAKKIEDLEREADELKTKTTPGVALPADDTERLRQWWDKFGGTNKPSGRSR